MLYGLHHPGKRNNRKQKFRGLSCSVPPTYTANDVIRPDGFLLLLVYRSYRLAGVKQAVRRCQAYHALNFKLPNALRSQDKFLHKTR